MTPILFDEQPFFREAFVDVTAAVVGVSRSTWVSAQSLTTPIEARQRMADGCYDILPIDTGSGPIQEYFTTETWNSFEGSVLRKSIARRDVLPALERIDNVIRALAIENR